MRDYPCIYRQLSPGLQQRVAHLALLQQRAAVLARLPTVVIAKGKPTRWAATPAPVLLQQVQILAKGAYPRLNELLLSNWFLHKADLRQAVRQALCQHGYFVLSTGLLPRPCAHAVPLRPEDVQPSGPNGPLTFRPEGQPVPELAGFAPEEVLLMADLMGWCAYRPTRAELPATPAFFDSLGVLYDALTRVTQMLDFARALPPDAPAAQAAARHELLPEAGEAAEKALNWAATYQALLPLLISLYEMVELPPTATADVIAVTEVEAAATKCEQLARYFLYRHEGGGWLAEVLSDALRIGHVSQPDFAPLRDVHALALALHERLAPALVDGADPGLFEDLTTEIEPLFSLLRWITNPARLADLPEGDPHLAALEAAVPPAVVTALLMQKLVVKPAPAA